MPSWPAVVGGVPFSETTLRNKWGSYVVRHSLKSDLWSKLSRSGAAASGAASYAEHVRAVEAARRLAAAEAREASEKARRLKDAEAALRAEAKAAATRGRMETVDAWLAAADVDAALAARLSQTYAGYAWRSGSLLSLLSPSPPHRPASRRRICGRVLSTIRGGVTPAATPSRSSRRWSWPPAPPVARCGAGACSRDTSLTTAARKTSG